tara:strand:+ start:475 stop:1878 length:1404 start_codon:yes stop_codon:yes gene_type:complete
MSYIQNNDPYKEKTSTEFLEFFSDKEVNNTQNSKKDMDAYSAYEDSVSIKYLEGRKKNKRKNTKPLDTLIETESDTDLRQTQDKLKTNSRQTQDKPTLHKLNTDLPQTYHRLTTNPDTDLPQSSHTPPTFLPQSSHNPPTFLPQSSHIPPTKPDTTLPHSSHKNDDIPDLHNLSVMGMKIMQYIFDICVNSGNKITPRLRHKNIAEALNLNSNSIRNTIQRMIDKGFISRRSNAIGDNRGSQYIIGDYVYQKMVILPHSYHTPPTKPDTKPDTKSSSSSSMLLNENIKKTTTRNNQLNISELPPEWKNINFFGLNQTIKFGKDQLINIYNAQVLSANDVEESLERFANDLDKGLIKAKTGSLNFLMGIFLKQKTAYESNDPNFRTEDELFLEKQLNAKIEKDKQMKTLKEKACNASFNIWENNLSKNDRERILKDMSYDYTKENKENRIKLLKHHHREIVWPKELNS